MIDFQTLCTAKKVLLILKRSLFRIGSNQLSLFYLVGVLVMQQQSHRIMHLIEHFNVSGLNHFFAMQPTTVTTYDFLSWIMALIMFFFCSTSVCLQFLKKFEFSRQKHFWWLNHELHDELFKYFFNNWTNWSSWLRVHWVDF